MRQFVKISPTFWVGQTGKDLRKAGPAVQLVALYLISNPHVNYIGVYRLPLAYARSDLKMSEKALTKALSILERIGFAKFDPPSEMVWVCQGARWQIGESLAKTDRRVKFVQGEFNALPMDCPLRSAFFDRYDKSLLLSESPPEKRWSPKSSSNTDWDVPEESGRTGLRDI